MELELELGLRLGLKLELLKKHWFCKLFGGPGSGFVEKALVL